MLFMWGFWYDLTKQVIYVLLFVWPCAWKSWDLQNQLLWNISELKG